MQRRVKVSVEFLREVRKTVDAYYHTNKDVLDEADAEAILKQIYKLDEVTGCRKSKS